jgi:hypothetical protein
MKKNYLIFFLLFPFIIFAQVEFVSTQTANLSDYSGAINFSGLGEYQIFLDTNDGVLDKPVIVVDGFDPGDGRSISGLYDLLSYTDANGPQNLADFVRSQGFDVVILNFPQYLRLADDSLLNIANVTDTNGDMIIDQLDFPAGSTLIDGGSDFIERNAMLLIDLINTLNTDKVGNEELIIIGPSMGGLISRYALNFMENAGQNHETRLWFSFDAPHNGANVPLGLQHQLNYLAFGLGSNNVTTIQPLVNGFLKSAAARQLLVDHFESHLQNGSVVDFDPTKLTPEAHPFRTTFETHINSLTSTGFPENTRNVSMINGSGIGNSYFAMGNSGTTVSPGFSVIDVIIPNIATATDAELKINFTPTTANNSQLISSIKVTAFGFLVLVDVSANAQAFSYSDGIDAASGGLFDLSVLTAGIGAGGGVAADFLNALTIDKFNFIPSVSGMALTFPNNEIDWFHTIDLGDPVSGGGTDTSPFINWYMPDANEGHVTLNETSALFAISEIIPPTLSVNSNEEIDLRIERNPITDNLTILSNIIINNASINIIDLTGKVVYKSNSVSLSNRTSFPVNLSSGLYVLNITNSENFDFKAKLIVK